MSVPDAIASNTASQHLSFEFEPNFLGVRSVLSQVSADLKDVLTDEQFAKVEIVLAEALNNIAEHAFVDHDGATPCSAIEVACYETHLRVLLEDNGRALPDHKIPQASPLEFDPCDIDGLPEGGFGWGLIHSLVKELTYIRASGKNQLRMTIVL